MSPNKKVTKEVGLRGAECRTAARQSRPLKNPPAALGKRLLFYLFFFQVCQKRQIVLAFRQAQSDTTHGSHQVRAGKGLGRAALLAGASNSAPPRSASLLPFLPKQERKAPGRGQGAPGLRKIEKIVPPLAISGGNIQRFCHYMLLRLKGRCGGEHSQKCHRAGVKTCPYRCARRISISSLEGFWSGSKRKRH